MLPLNELYLFKMSPEVSLSEGSLLSRKELWSWIQQLWVRDLSLLLTCSISQEEHSFQGRGPFPRAVSHSRQSRQNQITYLNGPQFRDGLYRTIAKMVGSMHRKSMNRSMAR